MTEHYYNPDQASPLVGAAASTIRNWCKTYADHLSAGANPPPGNERRLTQQDVAKLQQVKVWRDERRSAQEIATLLQAAATANEPTHLTIDVAPTPPPNAQEGRGDDLLLPVALSSIQSRQDATDDRVAAMQRQLETLAEEQRAQMLQAIKWAEWRGALWAALLCGLLLFAWLLVNGSPW